MIPQTTRLEAGLAGLPKLKQRPLPARYGTPWSLVLAVSDLAVFVGAVLVAQAATHTSLAALPVHEGARMAVLFGFVLSISLFERIGMYRGSFSASARDEVYASLAASGMAMLPALGLFLLVPALVPYRHVLVASLLLTAAGVGLVRYAGHHLRTRVFPPLSRRIAVVGTPGRVAAVPGELSLTASDTVIRLAIEGFDEDLARVVESGDLGDLDWLQAANERGCRELIITEALPPEIMPALLRYTELHHMKLAFAPMRIRPHACDFVVRRDGGLALLYPQSLAICTPGANLLRRTLDLALAIPALVLLAPLMAGIAVAILIDGGHPILYRQTRVGRHGAHFSMLKFRTMFPDAEAASGPIWARNGEARTTRVGKYLRRSSLDELPQLINVLLGDMSIVGPRPERPYYVEQFRRMLPRYDERHLVRPGITGWSHVHMRRNVDASHIGERLGYDLFYLEHWSVFMDFLIICKTAAEFLFHSAV